MSKQEDSNTKKNAFRKSSNITILHENFAVLSKEQSNVIGQVFEPLPEYGTNKPKPPPITRLETIIFGLGVEKEDTKKIYSSEKEFDLANYEKSKKYYKDTDGKLYDYNNGQELKENGEKIAELTFNLGQKYQENSYTYAFKQEINGILLDLNLKQSRSFGLIPESLGKAKIELQNKINSEINSELLSNIDNIKSNPTMLTIVNDIIDKNKFKDETLENKLSAIVSSKNALQEFIKASENKGLLMQGDKLSSALNVVKYKSEQNTFPLLSEHMPTYQYSALLRNSDEILRKYQEVEKRFEKQPTIAYGATIIINDNKPTHEEYVKAVTKLIFDQKQITGLSPSSSTFSEDLKKLSPEKLGKLEIAFEQGNDAVAYKINPKDFIKIMQKMDLELIKKMDPEYIRQNNPGNKNITETGFRSIVASGLENAGINEKNLADSFEKRNQEKIKKKFEKGRVAAQVELLDAQLKANDKKPVDPKNIIFPEDVRKLVQAERVNDIKKLQSGIKIDSAKQSQNLSSEISQPKTTKIIDVHDKLASKKLSSQSIPRKMERETSTKNEVVQSAPIKTLRPLPQIPQSLAQNKLTPVGKIQALKQQPIELNSSQIINPSIKSEVEQVSSLKRSSIVIGSAKQRTKLPLEIQQPQTTKVPEQITQSSPITYKDTIRPRNSLSPNTIIDQSKLTSIGKVQASGQQPVELNSSQRISPKPLPKRPIKTNLNEENIMPKKPIEENKLAEVPKQPKANQNKSSEKLREAILEKAFDKVLGKGGYQTAQDLKNLGPKKVMENKVKAYKDGIVDKFDTRKNQVKDTVKGIKDFSIKEQVQKGKQSYKDLDGKQEIKDRLKRDFKIDTKDLNNLKQAGKDIKKGLADIAREIGNKVKENIGTSSAKGTSTPNNKSTGKDHQR